MAQAKPSPPDTRADCGQSVGAVGREGAAFRPRSSHNRLKIQRESRHGGHLRALPACPPADAGPSLGVTGFVQGLSQANPKPAPRANRAAHSVGRSSPHATQQAQPSAFASGGPLTPPAEPRANAWPCGSSNWSSHWPHWAPASACWSEIPENSANPGSRSSG